MRKLINYIRSCFCKHDWKIFNVEKIYIDADDWIRYIEQPYTIKIKWTYRCKKCGHMKTHKNY